MEGWMVKMSDVEVQEMDEWIEGRESVRGG